MNSILYSCQILTKLIFSTDFRKILKISNFIKIHKWEPNSMRTDSCRSLWPARATAKISLAAPRHPLAVPVGWGFLGGGIYCLNQLTTALSPIGRKHHNELQGTLYYQ